LIGYADSGYQSDPPQREITNKLYVYIWRYCNFLEIDQINISGYFIKSFRNYCNPWSKSRMCMAKINYPVHKKRYGLLTIKKSPIILFEDNVFCITQIRGGYIKGDKTKHILPKFFYTHKLKQKGKIDIKQIRSNDNLTELFIKSLTIHYQKIDKYKRKYRRNIYVGNILMDFTDDNIPSVYTEEITVGNK